MSQETIALAKQIAMIVGVVAGISAILFAILPPETAFLIELFLFSVFLILLVLVQRGRGGGLAGALGGAGGSSAFGAKAGDAFTRFTIVAASLWIVLCVSAAVWSKHGLTDKLGNAGPVGGVIGEAPIEDGGAGAADDEGAGETDSADADSTEEDS